MSDARIDPDLGVEVFVLDHWVPGPVCQAKSEPAAIRPNGPQDKRRKEPTMAVKLNRTAYDHAKRLVEEGEVVLDERDDWSEHQPSAATENAFIEEHGFGEYSKWHLGVDDEKPAGHEGALQVSLRRLRERAPLRSSGGRVTRGPAQVRRHRVRRSAPARHARRCGRGPLAAKPAGLTSGGLLDVPGALEVLIRQAAPPSRPHRPLRPHA